MPSPDLAHTIPAAHLLHVIELVKRWGIAEKVLLESTGVDASRLADPEQTLLVSSFVQVLERARTLTNEPGIGVYLGLQARPTGSGYLGFAAMSAPKLREAIRLAIQYFPIRTTALSLSGHVEGEAAVMVIEEHADFGSARDIVLFATMIGLRQVGCALIGRELNLQFDFAFPRPSYFDHFEAGFLGVRFDQPENRLTGRAAGLDSPIAMSDPEALQLARAHCDRLLQSLGLDGRTTPRVRTALVANGQTLSLDEVAHVLSMSTRTLRRRLSEEGTSFAALTREATEARALTLLRSSALSVDEIAAQLGYGNTPNFIRAFRRWTGKTPHAYRKHN